ncbi:MAG: hypothetical protein GX061_02670 [Eubacteriaceae bacterium]|nr:hypothetical protein [Eubacteriaceae bacterium]
MSFFIGLLPALFWGINPVLVSKCGGKPINQQLGTAFACGILAVVTYVIIRPAMTTAIFIGCLISGLAWSIGQLCQYTSYVVLGTSRAFAISISIEMFLNSMVASLIFREWQTPRQLILGFAAIACVILGGNFTAYESEKGSVDMKKGLIILTVGALGFCVWNYAIRFVGAEGFDAVCPQAIGMVVGSLILSCFVGKDVKKFDKSTFKQTLAGLCYACANFALIFSNKLNGVGVGYTMAQLCLVFEFIFGIVILKEKRTKKELTHSIWGAAFITVGCIMIGLI